MVRLTLWVKPMGLLMSVLDSLDHAFDDADVPEFDDEVRCFGFSLGPVKVNFYYMDQ